MAHDIFISYSRRDSEIADKICSALDEAGISYFIDRKGIVGGREFPTILAEAILNCKVVLLLGSANAYESKYTMREITFAFNEKPKDSVLLYRIDKAEMPAGLRLVFSNVQWRDLQSHPIETALVDDLLELLGIEKTVKKQILTTTQAASGQKTAQPKQLAQQKSRRAKIVRYMLLGVLIVAVVLWLQSLLDEESDEYSAQTTAVDSSLNEGDLSRQVGVLTTTFSQEDLSQLIADEARAVAGVDLCFLHLRGVRLRALDEGGVTLKDVYSIDPFCNSMVTTTMSAQEIKTLIINSFNVNPNRFAGEIVPSGLTYVIKTTPDGQASDVQLHLEETKSLYRVIISEFIYENKADYDYPRRAKVSTETLSVRDILLGAFERGPVGRNNRIKIE